MPEENEEQTVRKMSKKEFWIRFGVWVTLAVIVPIVYVAIAYGLFSPNSSSGVRLSGWGVIAIIFVFIILTFVIQTAKAGLSYGNIFRQCIEGYTILMWLLAAIILIHNARNSLESFERFLIITFVCEALAVPANPLRKWAEEHNIESMTQIIAGAIKRGTKKDE